MRLYVCMYICIVCAVAVMPMRSFTLWLFALFFHLLPKTTHKLVVEAFGSANIFPLRVIRVD